MMDSQYFGLESYFNKNVTFYKNVNFYDDVNLDNIISKSISTKNLYVDGDVTISGSLTGSVNFKQQGVGAVNQTIQNKLHDLVSVKDFGAVGDGVTDDRAAIQSAVDAHKRVYIPDGFYYISSGIVLSDSRSCLIGDERTPRLIIPAGAGPAVKIIALPNGGFNEFSRVENIQFWCTYTRGGDTQTYSGNPSSNDCGVLIDGSAATAATFHPVQRAQIKNCRINGFACGINVKNSVNTLLERIFIEPNDESRATYPFPAGLTASNKYIGVNFDLTKHAQAPGTSISPQASIEVRQVIVFLGGAPPSVTSMGFRMEGEDPRDIFFDACETAGGMYGFFIKPTSSDYNIDIHIKRPIVDLCSRSGIWIENWNGYGSLCVDGGYVAKNQNIGGSAHVWIQNSRGVAVNGMQLIGVLSNADQDDGIRVNGSRSISVIGNIFQNCTYGISIENSTFCSVIGNNIASHAGAFEPTPNLIEGIRVFGGSRNNAIVGNNITGANTTYKYLHGIRIENGNQFNFVSSNVVNDVDIETPYTILDSSTTLIDQQRYIANTIELISRNGQFLYQGNDATYPHLFKDGGGYNIAGVTNSGAWTSLSDITLKENINPLQYGVETIKNLSPVTYQLLSERNLAENNGTPCPTRLGFVAQEVQKYIPELISHMGEEQKLALEQTGIIPILVKAIQELDTRLQNIEISYPTT